MPGRNVASVDDHAGVEEDEYATDEESMFIDGESTVAAWRESQQVSSGNGASLTANTENSPAAATAAASMTASRTKVENDTPTNKMNSSGRSNQRSAKMATIVDTENVPTDGVVQDDRENQSSCCPIKKSRRFWMILAVLMTLVAISVGLATYFLFTHEETSTAAKAYNSIGSGNDEDEATLDKRDRPQESEGDGETVNSNIDNGNGDAMAPDEDDSTVAPEEDEEPAPVDESTTTETPEASVSTPSPVASTPAASPATELSTRLQSVLDAVVPDSQALLDPSTPQGSALVWLQSQNSLPLDTDNQIVQRYAVVTTAVSLQGSVPSFIDPSTSECEWEGVVCAYRNATDIFDAGFDPTVNATDGVIEMVVVGIIWSNHSLSGTIPDDIGLLTSLQTLDVGENSIQGQIPGGVYQLQELEYLFLHGNQLGGSISTAIGNLQKLNKLLMANNKFTGTIPQELGFSSTGQARQTTWISLYNNQFSGPLPLNWNLRKLFYLDLGRNFLTGTIPDDWVDGDNALVSLRLLYLDYNNLGGPLPALWTNLGTGRMKSMILNNNTFTGEVPGGYQVTNTLYLYDFQHNDFSSMNKDLCKLLIFEEGEVMSFRADCDICGCKYFCGQGECYA